ncbi:hypothetical protein E1301_Tti016405 [Triplophysa tibetana]|uniref:Uncharacterized protein n=1 Tax=Triplophysa tibetana TaxID=1572043 RepID=A0A5A9MWB9_9TELE|nr:hypothetical protein E1301_Tti016405 [Triplophysa tibetana]
MQRSSRGDGTCVYMTQVHLLISSCGSPQTLTSVIQLPVKTLHSGSSERFRVTLERAVFPMHHSLIKNSSSCRLMSLGTDYAGLYIMSVCLLLGLSIPHPLVSAFSPALYQNHWTLVVGCLTNKLLHVVAQENEHARSSKSPPAQDRVWQKLSPLALELPLNSTLACLQQTFDWGLGCFPIGQAIQMCCWMLEHPSELIALRLRNQTVNYCEAASLSQTLSERPALMSGAVPSFVGMGKGKELGFMGKASLQIRCTERRCVMRPR